MRAANHVDVVSGSERKGVFRLPVNQLAVAQSRYVSEIKVLRIGSSMLRRSRWPKLVGNGLTTPNFMFAQPWSAGSSGANRSYTK